MKEWSSQRKREEIKDPHIRKRLSSTGQLESGTCNYCNSIPSNHYCRAKVKGSGIKISGSDDKSVGNCHACSAAKNGGMQKITQTCANIMQTIKYSKELLC